METPKRCESKDGALNESWEELHFQQQRSLSQQVSGFTTPESLNSSSRSVPLTGLSSGQVEKLLLEAQRESRGSSRMSSQASSRGSPKSPNSPNNELAPPSLSITERVQEVQVLEAVQQAEVLPADFIWDWSSRPEALPPSEPSKQFRHPTGVRPKLSVRNTNVMRSSLFCLKNLPTLIVTHACTFFVGAAVVFIYLKKYCKWQPAITTIATF